MIDLVPALSVILQFGFLGCLTYLIIEGVVFAGWWVSALREHRRRNSSNRVQDYELLSSSRFTIPVSVVVPAFNEAVAIVPVVRALLAFRYPEFEVIVVNDGSTDDTLERLEQEFQLHRSLVVSRGALRSKEARATYRSATEPRLVVIDKPNGGKADALNAGINVARYRYLCCVDADTFYEPDALLKGMRLAMEDARRVIAVTSHVTPASYPEMTSAGRGERRVDGSWLVNFQQLEYLRSFLIARLAWSRRNYMMVTPGAFMIYRRDVVEELGGFSTSFTCEDIELTFRAHEHYRRQDREYRIASLPHTVAYTEAPRKIKSLVSQRARWQRVTMETTWHYRCMFANPRYGRVGFIGMPYYVFYESLSPLVDFLALAMIPIAWTLGGFSWTTFACLLGAAALLNAVVTTSAIILADAFPQYPVRDILRLMALAPLEVLVYRPLLLFARCLGVWQFCRRDKSWDRFPRNARPAVRLPGVARG